MRSRELWLRLSQWALTLSVVILDQASKVVVFNAFAHGETREVLGETVRLTFVKNSGAAFGLFPGVAPVLMIFTVVAVVGILWYRTRTSAEMWWIQVPLSLILGGALGNLVDRVRFGWVVDFIDVGAFGYRWPSFNVADIAISVGVGALLLVVLFAPQKAEDFPDGPEAKEN